MRAPQKLADAENINLQFEGQYPWGEASLQADWSVELELLADALRAIDQNQRLDLTRQFLDARAARRESARLSPELVAYEQQREWLEGLARYAELEIWRLADQKAYSPLGDTSALNDFNGYAGFEARW